MINSTTNFVEHPKLVAQRIGRYADIVGRERVIAGVDCGFGTAVRTDPIVADSIVWAKLKALGEGAAIASSAAVGLEGGMMSDVCRVLLAAAIASSLLMPAAASAKPAGGHPSRAKIKVHPDPPLAWLRISSGLSAAACGDQRPARSLAPTRARKREWRYWDYYGNVRYGWGRPGFYRGRYNGGSFGPCWTSTPIGMMPTCGQ